AATDDDAAQGVLLRDGDRDDVLDPARGLHGVHAQARPQAARRAARRRDAAADPLDHRELVIGSPNSAASSATSPGDSATSSAASALARCAGVRGPMIAASTWG